MEPGAIIGDGDRKRGVHAKPCVVAKNIFLEKNALPFTSKTLADVADYDSWWNQALPPHFSENGGGWTGNEPH